MYVQKGKSRRIFLEHLIDHTHTPPIFYTLQSLRVLSFYDHGLGRAGAEELAAALARGGFRDSLESLYVRADRVGERLGEKEKKGQGWGRRH